MIGRFRYVAAPVLVIVLGFAAVYALGNFLEQNRPELPYKYEDADLALQGKRLKGFALGAEGLLADWYWINSLQYLGGKIANSNTDVLNIEDLTPLNPRLLYPYLENATDLDPKFMAAYSYGAVVLPAIDAEKAIHLTEKGITYNPNQWRLYQYLGYIYWRLKDFEKASAAYEAGSRIEGSPAFLKFMAAAMKTQGGSRDTAREMYSQMLAQADDNSSIDTATRRLMEIDSLDERDAIRSALKRFNDTNGRCASGFDEILPLLRPVKLPYGRVFRLDQQNRIVDPSGAPYILDRVTCDVKLDAERTKVPVM